MCLQQTISDWRVAGTLGAKSVLRIFFIIVLKWFLCEGQHGFIQFIYSNDQKLALLWLSNPLTIKVSAIFYYVENLVEVQFFDFPQSYLACLIYNCRSVDLNLD